MCRGVIPGFHIFKGKEELLNWVLSTQSYPLALHGCQAVDRFCATVRGVCQAGMLHQQNVSNGTLGTGRAVRSVLVEPYAQYWHFSSAVFLRVAENASGGRSIPRCSALKSLCALLTSPEQQRCVRYYSRHPSLPVDCFPIDCCPMKYCRF